MQTEEVVGAAGAGSGVGRGDDAGRSRKKSTAVKGGAKDKGKERSMFEKAFGKLW